MIYTWEMEAGRALLIAGELLLAGACVLLFLSLYGLRASFLPPPLVYLGRISYGLYVFHLLCLAMIHKFAVTVLKTVPLTFSMALEYVLSLALTIVLASLSYRFFEMPFLRLKTRFTFVKSRD